MNLQMIAFTVFVTTYFPKHVSLNIFYNPNFNPNPFPFAHAPRSVHSELCVFFPNLTLDRPKLKGWSKSYG